MNPILVAATVAASLVLLASLQWLAVVLRELPAERRPRRGGRTQESAGTAPPRLRQLERLAEEALAGDRVAVARLAGLAASAARRSGVPVDEAEVRAVSSPAELLTTLDRWERSLAAVRGGQPTSRRQAEV